MGTFFGLLECLRPFVGVTFDAARHSLSSKIQSSFAVSEGFDGGDCCSCTCKTGEEHTCGLKGYNCQDPFADCFESATSATDDSNDIPVDNGICQFGGFSAGDGYCSSLFNTPECGELISIVFPLGANRYGPV